MLVRTPVNNHNVNNLHQSRRSAPTVNQVSNVKSPKSNSDYRICTFKNEGGYGFKLTGNAPVRVQSVKKDCLAWKSGLRENDIIRKVNDIPVTDRRNEYVSDLLRKHSTIRLWVESGYTRTIIPPENVSVKLRNIPHASIRPPIKDQSPQRPKTTSRPIPKPITVTRPKTIAIPNDQSQKHIPHQPIRHPPNLSTKVTNESRQPTVKNYSTSSSSESSMSSSSTESNIFGPYCDPQPTVFTSSRSLPTTTPMTQSNSYNVPPVKKRPPPPPVNLPIPKHKTIPADGVKSYTITADNDDEGKLNDKSKSSTLPKKTANGRIQGREFDNDSQDEDESEMSLTVIKMLKSTNDSLSKPGLVAILLNYVKEKPIDMKTMIFFYSCKLYQTLSKNQDFLAYAPIMANEIVTTFLHEKSPLYININPELLSEILRNIKIKEKLSTIFKTIMESVYENIKKIIEDVRGKLERGIQLSEDVSSSVNVFNSITSQDRELGLLYRSICNIFTRSQKDSSLNDSVSATQIGLATMYQYFHNITFAPGSSIRARSTDCINKAINPSKLISISEYFKIPILCAGSPLKSSQSFRKKSKTVSGHVLVETVCLAPELCSICGELLWGAAPQGLLCTMCTSYYHVKCKRLIKDKCARKLRKSNSGSNKEEKAPFSLRLNRKSSTNSTISPVSAEILNNGGNHFFGNGALIPDEKIGKIPLDGVVDISKSHSAEQLDRSNKIPSQFDRVGSGSNLIGSTVRPSLDFDQVLVEVNELVDISLTDPDMKIDDSFDADAEINAVFPKLNPESDKRILIVLLEFYHKTRYILMNLKRYWYCIVLKWPSTQYSYFKALSLDCISPLVDLIKDLVLTIEKCISEHEFIGLPEAVLHWLSENDDEHLKTWLSLSSNLSCTNSLNILKQLKQMSLTMIPELANILKVKFNKRIMIDDLAQIRPLLISLPFITKNIIKSLCKQESKYLEEISLWKQISTKMDYLVEYIDRCCIPFVEFINNGTIVRRADKFEGQIKWKDSENDIRDFYNDFPRTFFHFQIFDFQIAKIIDWTTNTSSTENDGEMKSIERSKSSILPKKMDYQTTYFKKGTEVLLIIYRTFIAVLQKENEHFVLKPIKAIKGGFEKKPPFITISSDNFFKDGRQEDNQFVLNIISNMKDNVLLVRIGFSHSEVLDNLLDFINMKNYNLGRSLSLFKNNDFVAITEPMPYLERNPTTLSNKSKSSNDTIDSVPLTNGNPELEDKDVNMPSPSYIALSKALTNASEALDSKTLLCGLMKVPDSDFTNKLQILKDDGVKSEEELIVLLYSLTQSTIQQTQKLLVSCCPKLDGSSNFDVEEVKSTLTKTYDLLDKWDKSKQITPEVISPEVVMRLRSNNRKSNPFIDDMSMKLDVLCQGDYEVYNEELIPVVDINGEDITNNDIENDDITVTFDGIIEDQVDQVQPSSNQRESYKYEPSESRLPDLIAIDLMEPITTLVPNDMSLIDETITISRSQIIIPNRNSMHSSV